MRKLILATAGAIASVGVLAAASMATSPSPYYVYTYFSDATLTQQVGQNFQTCAYSGVIQDNVTGTVTSYWERDLLGYCTPGGDLN